MDSRWKRNGDGSVVHHWSCAFGVIPWLWAEGFTAQRMLDYVESRCDLRMCKRCEKFFIRSRAR